MLPLSEGLHYYTFSSPSESQSDDFRESRKQNWSCQKDLTWKCTDFCVSFGSWESLIVNIFLKELLVFIVDVQCNLKIECRVERNGNSAPQFTRFWRNSYLLCPNLNSQVLNLPPTKTFKYSLFHTGLWVSEWPTTSPVAQKHKRSWTMPLPLSQA